MSIEKLDSAVQIKAETVREILAGMRLVPKRIQSKYFYNEKGSALFDAICELPEYYPTRTESSIMEAHAREMIEVIGSDSILVELGSGSSTKTRLLLDQSHSLAAYVPVDISADHLENSAERLRLEYPDLLIESVAADYTRSFLLPDSVPQKKRRVVYFPGSTFGNFYPAEGALFLSQIRDFVGSKGGLLIGLDWRKDRERLEAAYNDSQGVTAAFNLNILANVNQLTGADFDEGGFKHFACFDEDEGRIEMHLVSKTDQLVRIANESFRIEQDEAILTEVSYKHRPEDFLELAAKSGFTLRKTWTDAENLFGVLYLAAA